jgi:hypothetical protein
MANYKPSAPDMTPVAGQQQIAPRSQNPLKPAHPYGADYIEITGKCTLRRLSDGAIAHSTYKLSEDKFATNRSHVYIPIDPDFGAMIGNVVNSLQAYHIDNWTDKPMLAQLTALLRGVIIDYTDTYGRNHNWECLASPDDVDSRVSVAEYAEVSNG